MTTSARVRLEREIVRELQESGASVRLLPNWPAKATYYTKEGRVMPNLPADPWSMKRYLARGFTLTPPVKEESGELICDECGAGPFKAKIGLAGHKRTHNKEEK